MTPVTVANGASGYPSQAYAFSATIGKGKLPVSVIAAEHHAVKPIVVSAGQTFDIAFDSNTASTGYAWTTANIVTDGVIEQAGDPTITAPDTNLPGGSGVTLMHYKAIAAGSAELVIMNQAPGSNGVPAAIYMTVVTVQ